MDRWNFFPASTRDARLTLFWEELGKAYERGGVKQRMQCITEKMVGKWNKFPQLKSKAAESKHLCIPMLDILEKFNVADAEWSDELLHCRRCFELLVGMFDIIDSNGMFLPTSASSDLLNMTERFQQHYNWLFVKADERGDQQWLFTTKLHCLWHTMYFARWLSPKASWTFSFEDFIGRLKTAGRACVHGTSMHKVRGNLFAIT